MNWYMFALVSGVISGGFAIAVLVVIACDWIDDRLGDFAAICFRLLLIAVVAGLVAAVLA